MRCERTDEGDVTTLTVYGTLDAVSSPDFRMVAYEVIQTGRKNVTLALADLGLIDNSGVGVIVDLYKRLSASDRKLTITDLKDQPRAVFRLLRLDRVFTIIHPSGEEVGK